MPSAAIREAARATQRRAERVAADRDRHPVMAEVLALNPLRAQIHGRDVVLTRGQTLTFTRLLRAELLRAGSVPIKVGDTLIVRQLANGDWVATDVVGLIGDDDSDTSDINTVIPVVDPTIGYMRTADFAQPGVLSGGVFTRTSASAGSLSAGVAEVLTAGGVLVRVTWPTTVISGVPAAGANGRVDQVVVDSTGAVTLLQGTPAPGAISTLDDANSTASRAAIPAGSLRLWEYVATASGIIAVANGSVFRDRRPWAKGFHGHTTPLAANLTVPSPSDVVVTGSTRRIESSGMPLRVSFYGSGDDGNSDRTRYSIYVDNVLASSTIADGIANLGGITLLHTGWTYEITLAAGSHLVEVRVHGDGSATPPVLYAGSFVCYQEQMQNLVSNGSS